MENIYYDLSIIKNKTDLDGKKPSIYLISTNRSAGKTTACLIESLERYKMHGEHVCFLYRTNYELNACSTLYEDVLKMYPDYGVEIKSISYAKGLFYKIFLDGCLFGFAVSINQSDKLRKYSPIFANVSMAIFDEYQLENGRYLKNEVALLQSTLTTIARGGGEQSRNIDLFMLGNNVSLLNPYYIAFGIHKRLKSNTHFLRGHGWIAEFGFNKSASKAILENPLLNAFSGDYLEYSAKEKVYLNDAEIFIEKLSGKSRYCFTIVHENKKYGVYEYYYEGYVYISKKIEPSCKEIYAFDNKSHNDETILVPRYSYVGDFLMSAYKEGLLRFSDMESKNAVIDILAINLYK